MKIYESILPGIIIIKPNLFTDNRGSFYEMFQQERYADLGIPAFVQDNISHSKKNVLRGLHYQFPQSQGKLVGVLKGTIWDVMVDIRIHSATFGKWFGILLSDQHPTQVYIPPGFAHGFCVLSEEAYFYYKCTDFYFPSFERGIAWNDRKLDIPWPIRHPILSAKDELFPWLHEINHDCLFT